MFKRKRKKNQEPVKVVPDGRYVIVSARASADNWEGHAHWLEVNEIYVDDPEFDDLLAQSISDAEHKAAVLQAWQTKNANFRIRARWMHSTNRYVTVEARCGKKWIEIESIHAKSENFEELIASAISKAEHKAATLRAWAPA